MKQFILKNKMPFAGLAACLLIGIITLSFQDTPYVKAILDNQPPPQDTIKKKKNSMTMKEFNKLADNLDKEILDEIRKIDYAKIEKDAKEGLEKIDIDKMMMEVDASLKKVDVEKILAEVSAELKDINLEEINEQTKTALADAKKELEKASVEMKKIDRDAIKKELEQAKEQAEKSSLELKKIDMEKIMSQAREGIDKAKAALKEIKQMFTEMEADGLIDSKKGFTIEYKDKELFINNKKQTEQVTDKYRKYFKNERFEITIDKE